jgi:hypothetical protein
MSRRLLLLALSLVIIGAVVALSSSLHDVHFEPGRSIPMQTTSTSPLQTSPADTIAQTPLWKILLFWLALVINMVLFFFLMPKEMRKRVLRQMVSLALTALAVLIALRYRLINLPFLKQPPVEPSDQGPVGGGANEPLPAFQPPQMAPWWVFLVSFVVLAAVLTLLWLAYRWWMRPTGQRRSDLDAIEAIARSSLEEIASGRDSGDVIIQSYIRMSEAVGKRRGLERAPAATPREFAERLEQAGLPAREVSRLTRLFESVRYGGKASSQADVNEAVACLNSILQACGLAQ